MLYVDDILLIGNDIGQMSSVKIWLSQNFSMKDLGMQCTSWESGFIEIDPKD